MNAYDDWRVSRYLVDTAALTGHTGTKLRLVICPACERHLYRTDETVREHIGSHDPADFGLGQRSPTDSVSQGVPA